MRWSDGRLIGLIALLAVLVTAPSGAHAKQVIRLGTEDLPPYQMVENGQIVGVVMDRVTCALERMGQAHEVWLMDWTRAQLMTQNRELEGFFAAPTSAAHARYATPSDAVINEDLAWFMLPGRTIDPKSETDKLQARYSTEFATGKWLKLRREGYNVVRKPRDAEALLDMLLKGDIDVALEYETTFLHYMQARGLQASDVVKIPDQSQANMVHFSNVFLASDPQFLQRFNRFLAVCKAGDN